MDTSYALSCVVPDEQRPTSIDDVLGRQMIAPYIWPLEVASALRKSVRRGRFDLGGARELCAAVAALHVELLSPRSNDPLHHLDLAVAHDLTPYDALYLELALARRCALATHDTRLGGAARGLGIAVLN
jgi:predicted nucleic acid-binding protein